MAVNPVNPYQAPQAMLADVQFEAEHQPVKLFSVRGRIGRVRYLAYTIGVSAVCMLVVMLGVALSAVLAPVGLLLMVVAYIAMLVLQVMLTIQRSHDFDFSGWFSLLVFVPLGIFIFWLMPGTQGENRFGAQTPPNSGGAILVALILPIVFVTGILAAIAIPAYQDYVKRAQQAEQMQQAPQP